MTNSRWFMLGLLFVMYVLNTVDRHVINILLEPIRIDFGLTDSQAGFLAGYAFVIVYTLMGVPLAYLADRYNRKVLIAWCSAVWSIMTGLGGVATSYAGMALTRMGVGAGEAGLTPAANSLIGDLFEPGKRGKAIGYYQCAVPIGSMLAGVLGGLLAELIGWRWTFISLGIAGLLFTAIFHMFFRDPPRGCLDDPVSIPDKQRYSLIDTTKYLLSLKSVRYFFPAFALVGLIAAAVAAWTPAYLVRVHDMSMIRMATTFGIISGVGGVFGMILGGVITDRLGSKNPAYYLQIPAWALLICLPMYFVIYLTSNSWLAIGTLLGPMILGVPIVVPVLVLLQRLVKNNMRAVSVALFFLALHLFGSGMGPLLVGLISDLLVPFYGSDSLRVAILSIMPLNLVAVWLFWRASRLVASELLQTQHGKEL